MLAQWTLYTKVKQEYEKRDDYDALPCVSLQASQTLQKHAHLSNTEVESTLKKIEV